MWKYLAEAIWLERLWEVRHKAFPDETRTAFVKMLIGNPTYPFGSKSPLIPGLTNTLSSRGLRARSSGSKTSN